MKITCLKELKKRKILQLHDIVEFTMKKNKTIYYKVTNHFLANIENEGSANNKIFEILKVDKFKLAKEIYGYSVYSGNWPVYSGNWPRSKMNDYDALTRLVEKIYEIIEGKYHKKIIEITTRFDLMDLE